MAKMLSQLAAIIRGSVAGDTFTANQFAQIIVRARTAPVQPGTVNQTKVKSAFTSANVLWHDLSDADRQGWIDYAATLTYSGPLGSYKVPGRQVFLSNVGWASYLHDRDSLLGNVSKFPPLTPGFLGLANLNWDAPPGAGTGYKVTGTNTNIEQITVVVMNSLKFDSSRLRFKGPFKSNIIFTASPAPAAAFSIDVPNLLIDGIYFCSVRAISVSDPHRISPLFFLRAKAEGPP